MKLYRYVSVAIAGLGVAFHTHAAPTFTTDSLGNEGVTTDVFDVAQGTQVIFSSPQTTSSGFSDPRAAFGMDSGFVEATHSIFSDGSPVGTVDFIEWQTPNWINLSSFNLRLQQDGANPSRGASSFGLFASRDGLNFSKVSDGTIPTGVAGNANVPLLISDNALTGTTTNVRAFRLEVTRQTSAGVRVIELDATGTPGSQTGPYLDRLALNAPTNTLVGRPSNALNDDEGPGLVISGSATQGLNGDFFADVGGNNDGGVERDNYIFADGAGVDNGDLIFGNGGEFVDFISAQLGIPVNFAGFRINIATDAGSQNRGTQLIRSFVGGVEVDSFDNNGFSGEVLRTFAGGPVTGDSVRFEFTRSTTQGPRIIEIDALLAPEPSCAAMLAAGVGLLSFGRRHRTK